MHAHEIRRSAAAVLALFASAACSDAPAPRAALPDGLFLAGDAPALERALAPARELTGTPVAHAAAALSRRLDGCRGFTAHVEDGALDALPDAVRCSDAPLAPHLAELAGDADVVFGLPLGDPSGPRLIGRLAVSEQGGVAIDATLSPLEPDTALSHALPSGRGPGPPVMNTQDLLVHLRVRPEGGLDPTPLLATRKDRPALGDFATRLLAGAVFDGTIELGVYMPREGQAVPPIAFALGVRVAAGAEAAMEALVDEIEARWPLHASEARFGEAGELVGRCLLDLALLPEFAPCYVALPDRVVLGWNPPSLAQALAPLRDDRLGEAGGLYVALARLPEADRRLRQTIAPDAEGEPVGYGWRSLRIEGARAKDASLQLRLELDAGGAS